MRVLQTLPLPDLRPAARNGHSAAGSRARRRAHNELINCRNLYRGKEMTPAFAARFRSIGPAGSNSDTATTQTYPVIGFWHRWADLWRTGCPRRDDIAVKTPKSGSRPPSLKAAPWLTSSLW